MLRINRSQSVLRFQVVDVRREARRAGVVVPLADDVVPHFAQGVRSQEAQVLRQPFLPFHPEGIEEGFSGAHAMNKDIRELRERPRQTASTSAISRVCPVTPVSVSPGVAEREFGRFDLQRKQILCSSKGFLLAFAPLFSGQQSIGVWIPRRPPSSSEVFRFNV